MTEKEAHRIRSEFESIAKKYGLWLEIKETHKPELTDVVITASIKIKK